MDKIAHEAYVASPQRHAWCSVLSVTAAHVCMKLTTWSLCMNEADYHCWGDGVFPYCMYYSMLQTINKSGGFNTQLFILALFFHSHATVSTSMCVQVTSHNYMLTPLLLGLLLGCEWSPSLPEPGSTSGSLKGAPDSPPWLQVQTKKRGLLEASAGGGMNCEPQSSSKAVQIIFALCGNTI